MTGSYDRNCDWRSYQRELSPKDVAMAPVWKPMVKELCAELGVDCVDSGVGLVINGRFIALTGH